MKDESFFMNKLTDLRNDKYFKKLFLITTLATFALFFAIVSKLFGANTFD